MSLPESKYYKILKEMVFKPALYKEIADNLVQKCGKGNVPCIGYGKGYLYIVWNTQAETILVIYLSSFCR